MDESTTDRRMVETKRMCLKDFVVGVWGGNSVKSMRTMGSLGRFLVFLRVETDESYVPF